MSRKYKFGEKTGAYFISFATEKTKTIQLNTFKSIDFNYKQLKTINKKYNNESSNRFLIYNFVML